MLLHLLPRIQKVAIQIADAGAGKVRAVVLREQHDLVVQIEDVVVDGRGRKQDDFGAQAAASPPALSADQALQILIALRAATAEVVRFVDEDHIDIAVIERIETPVRAAQFFLREHLRRNGRAGEFALPHLAQRSRTHHQRLHPLMIGVVFQ